MTKSFTESLSILVLLLAMAGWGGCATIVHRGGSQEVPVASRPSTAKDVTQREPLTSQRDEPSYFSRAPQPLPSAHSNGQGQRELKLENEQREFSNVLPRR